MARKRGEKSSARTKHIAAENAVRPVRPPAPTPDALSTYVVVVEVPRQAPQTVAMESAMNILSMPSTLSPLVMRPALWDTPMMVPIVSNISMNRNVRTTTSISQDNTFEKSNLQKMGPTLSGSDMKTALPVSGFLTRLVTAAPVAGSLMTRPSAVEMSIPRRIPPLTFSITSPPVMNRPITPTRALPLVSSPRVTRVESESTMIPAF